uniref:Tumor protein, translationally-controlled 1 n=1 Tax=Sinocyclocheilus rhinocerous TaxID=307959 RepID=A0A673MQU7_9TELE
MLSCLIFIFFFFLFLFFFTGDEMFSDIYKIKESENGMMIEVEGKVCGRSEGDIDDALIGGNASAEVQDEGCDSSTVSGVDIVLNHKLQETSYDKKSYTAYIKDYMKAVKAKLQEVSPDRVDPFMANAPAEVKKILVMADTVIVPFLYMLKSLRLVRFLLSKSLFNQKYADIVKYCNLKLFCLNIV